MEPDLRCLNLSRPHGHQASSGCARAWATPAWPLTGPSSCPRGVVQRLLSQQLPVPSPGTPPLDLPLRERSPSPHTIRVNDPELSQHLDEAGAAGLPNRLRGAKAAVLLLP